MRPADLWIWPAIAGRKSKPFAQVPAPIVGCVYWDPGIEAQGSRPCAGVLHWLRRAIPD